MMILGMSAKSQSSGGTCHMSNSACSNMHPKCTKVGFLNDSVLLSLDVVMPQCPAKLTAI